MNSDENVNIENDLVSGGFAGNKFINSFKELNTHDKVSTIDQLFKITLQSMSDDRKNATNDISLEAVKANEQKYLIFMETWKQELQSKIYHNISRRNCYMQQIQYWFNKVNQFSNL